jgi:hypothetical protein
VPSQRAADAAQIGFRNCAGHAVLDRSAAADPEPDTVEGVDGDKRAPVEHGLRMLDLARNDILHHDGSKEAAATFEIADDGAEIGKPRTGHTVRLAVPIAAP